MKITKNPVERTCFINYLINNLWIINVFKKKSAALRCAKTKVKNYSLRLSIVLFIKRIEMCSWTNILSFDFLNRSTALNGHLYKSYALCKSDSDRPRQFTTINLLERVRTEQGSKESHNLPCNGLQSNMYIYIFYSSENKGYFLLCSQ